MLKPQPAGDLWWAKGSYQSVSGKIVSDWKIDEGTFSWKISIPPNTTATIYIPSTEGGSVTLDGRAAPEMKYEAGYAVGELGSGDYSIVSDYKKQ
jgi:alpha-L-rhamnosidase